MGGISDAGFPSMRQAFVEQQDIAEEINDVRTRNPLPHFPIVVVEEVIFDPNILSEEDKDEIRENVDNPEMVNRMPRRSIIGRKITREADRSNIKSSIFMPANSYDGQPVKPGEQVFVFYSDPYRSSRIGFWWCRVPEPIDVDDLNYTHGDRRYDTNQERTSAEKFEGPSQEDKPGFPNGDNENSDTKSLAGDKDYEAIVRSAKSTQIHTFEPVPRFSGRPGDKILQGSNNSRIVLGTDRNGPANVPPRPKSGAIDLVCGVGADFPNDGENAAGSSPRTIDNERGFRETDKTPERRGGVDNPSEGDPDFENDKSRIYLCMSGNPDDDFEIDIPTIEKTPGEKPCVVIKTNQGRIECREDLKIRVGGENGASVVIQADGNIVFIPGDDGVIRLGKNADKAILVQDVAIAQGGTVAGQGIISTMGGQIGVGGPSGVFSRKVLIE